LALALGDFQFAIYDCHCDNLKWNCQHDNLNWHMGLTLEGILVCLKKDRRAVKARQMSHDLLVVVATTYMQRTASLCLFKRANTCFFLRASSSWCLMLNG
jgi:hypothetical protein